MAGVWVATTTAELEVVLPDDAAAVVVTGVTLLPEVELPELWVLKIPSFGITAIPMTAIMRIITIIPAARTIFFRFLGFFGGRGAAVGIDEGTRGVGGRSLGEKSFGFCLFFSSGYGMEGAEASGWTGG